MNGAMSASADGLGVVRVGSYRAPARVVKEIRRGDRRVAS